MLAIDITVKKRFLFRFIHFYRYVDTAICFLTIIEFIYFGRCLVPKQFDRQGNTNFGMVQKHISITKQHWRERLAFIPSDQIRMDIVSSLTLQQ